MCDFDAAAVRLPQVKVDVMCGFVFVNLDFEAASLADSAPGMASDLAALVPRLAELEPAESFAFDSEQGAEWGANCLYTPDRSAIIPRR